MQIHVEAGELLVIAAIAVIALFWLWPTIAKGIVNRLKRIGKSKDRN